MQFKVAVREYVRFNDKFKYNLKGDDGQIRESYKELDDNDDQYQEEIYKLTFSPTNNDNPAEISKGKITFIIKNN